MKKRKAPKNTICLWYEKDALKAAKFYARIFPDTPRTAREPNSICHLIDDKRIGADPSPRLPFSIRAA